MVSILYRIASTTLIVTALILVLLLLTPFMDKRYAAKGRYFLWLLIIAGLCLPFVSAIPRPSIQIDVPIPEILQVQPMLANPEGSADPYERLESGEVSEPWDPSILLAVPDDVHEVQGFTPDIEEAPEEMPVPVATFGKTLHIPQIDIPTAVRLIWLAGLVMSLVYHSISYLSLRRFIRRWSSLETDTGILEIYRGEALRMGIRGNIRLMRCKGIKAPMLTGFLQPSLLLPERNYALTDLPFIFRHELTHYKHRDLWYKLALVFIKSVYWFNPAVHLMAAQACRDLEIVCDMQVVEGLEMPFRRRYSEIIISIAVDPGFCRTQLTTSFIGGKNMLKQRLTHILNANRKRGAGLFGIICAVIIVTSLTVGFNFVSAIGASEDNDPGEAITHNEQDNMSGIAGLSSYSHPSAAPSAAPIRNASVSPSPSANPDPVRNPMPDVSPTQDNSLKSVVNAQPVSATRKDTYDTLSELHALVYEEAVWVEREFTDITALDILTLADGIKLTQGGSKLTVKYPEWVADAYKIESSNGTLSIQQNTPCLKTETGGMSIQNYGWLNEYLKEQGKTLQPIEITIPAAMPLDSVHAGTGSGRIELQSIGNCKSVEINTGSGAVDANDCKMDSMNVATGSGKVNAVNCDISGALSIGVGSGQVDIRDCVTGSIDVGAGSGKVDIHDCVTGSIDVGAGSGNVTVANCDFSGTLSIGTASGSGSVTISDSAAQYDISFSTLNGKLTYNGQTVDKQSLRNTTAVKKITLSSVSGSFSVNDTK